MTPDYATKILALLAAREPRTNREIREALCPGAKSYVPEIDRALQRLRKAGQITPTGHGWVRTGRVTCPTCGGEGKVMP